MFRQCTYEHQNNTATVSSFRESNFQTHSVSKFADRNGITTILKCKQLYATQFLLSKPIRRPNPQALSAPFTFHCISTSNFWYPDGKYCEKYFTKAGLTLSCTPSWGGELLDSKSGIDHVYSASPKLSTQTAAFVYRKNYARRHSPWGLKQ